jgi:chemotaxis response regulator CheB
MALTDGEKGLPVDPVRVVLVDMPLLLREVIGRIVASEPRLDLVAEVGELARLGPVIEEWEPAFVIGGDERFSDADATAVLRRCPAARVLTVTSDGASSFLFELTPTRRAMGEISSKGLIEVILG